jgi:hypothetical protein
MTLNVPYKIRAALYVFTAVGTPVVTYLLARQIIGDLEMALWGAEVTVVAALAAFNTTPTKGENE